MGGRPRRPRPARPGSGDRGPRLVRLADRHRLVPPGRVGTTRSCRYAGPLAAPGQRRLRRQPGEPRRAGRAARTRAADRLAARGGGPASPAPAGHGRPAHHAARQRGHRVAAPPRRRLRGPAGGVRLPVRERRRPGGEGSPAARDPEPARSRGLLRRRRRPTPVRQPQRRPRRHQRRQRPYRHLPRPDATGPPDPAVAAHARLPDRGQCGRGAGGRDDGVRRQCQAAVGADDRLGARPPRDPPPDRARRDPAARRVARHDVLPHRDAVHRRRGVRPLLLLRPGPRRVPGGRTQLRRWGTSQDRGGAPQGRGDGGSRPGRAAAALR